MTKLAAAFELSLPPASPGVPAYRWLYSALRNEILHGRLSPGARLPATRDLSRQYGLARGTIINAFELLKSEGYVEGSVGSGTYVSRVLPEELLHVAPRAGTREAGQQGAHITVSRYAQRAKLFPGYENRPTRAFRCNLPALDLFPVHLWTQITTRCLRRVTSRLLMGCDALGYRPLREALAEYLSRSRGVKCVPEQLAIVSGVQEALDLAARILLNPGDRVCMENPGYSGAASAFQAFGAKISTAGLDEEGLCIGCLPPRAVRLVYVTPGHQFPLGTTMSLRRRLQLLEWARKTGALIFEDDYDSEYRFSGRPIPALQGLDNHELVIYAGSFSKVLFPALRLGYMVIPGTLLHHVEAVKSLTTRHAPVLEQVVLNSFIREGHFGRHLRRMRMVYSERFSVLLDEVRAKMTGMLEMSKVEAGLQTTARLLGGIDGKSAAAAAAKRDVEITPVSIYSEGNGKQDALQLGFAAVDPREIRRGVHELAAVLEAELKTRGARRPGR